MIRSLRSLEKISKARSPRGVCSTTIGTKAIGRLLITSSKGAFDGPFRTSPKIRLRGRSPRSKRTIQRSAIRLNSTSLSSPRPSSVVSQKSVGSRRRAGRGAPPRNRGFCALPEAKASLSWLLTSARCGLRLSVFRGGPPAPPGALSTSFWDRTLVYLKARSSPAQLGSRVPASPPLLHQGGPDPLQVAALLEHGPHRRRGSLARLGQPLDLGLHVALGRLERLL